MLDAPQDVVGLCGCLGTLLAHVQLAVSQDPRSLSAGLLSSISPPVCIYSQVQNLALALVKLHAVGD